MNSSGTLNIDVAGAIVEFAAILKEFKLKDELYRLVFRGKGLEFEGFRDFSPDDNAEEIDWKASARSPKLLVRQYKEERDLKVMFMIDVGSNMVFGSSEKLKCEFVAELVSAFANIIISANDKVGFLLFSDDVKIYVDCFGGEKQFQLLVDKLNRTENYGGKTDLNKALDYALDYFGNDISSLVILSDFFGVNPESESKLNLLSNHFETILIMTKDALDFSLPDSDTELVLESSSGKEQVIINPKVAKSLYEEYCVLQEKQAEQIFSRTKADFLRLVTNKSFAAPLAIFLKERLERR
jgi:hypothetical protein